MRPRAYPECYDAHGGPEQAAAMKAFTAVVERCAGTGLYVGCVPGLAGTHSQWALPGRIERQLGGSAALAPRGRKTIAGWRISSEHKRFKFGKGVGKLPVLKPREVY